jgi:hypothetical protein
MAAGQDRIAELLRARSQVYTELVDPEGRVTPAHGEF